MSAEDRAEIISLITEAVELGARKFKACEILDIEIRTIERWMKIPEDRRQGPHKKPSNALTEKERTEVLEIANSAEYANLTPWQIVPRLADNGKYIASESSFYRILKAEKMLAHRSKSNPRTYTKPTCLMATAPNQIWSWDISVPQQAVQRMRVGPSQSIYRDRLQTTVSGKG